MHKFHQKLHKKMRDKGWEPHHIEKTLHILSRANERKHPGIKMLDKGIAWAALMIIVIGNFIVSAALIPSILTMPAIITTIITAFFGLCFGFLMDVVIRDIDDMSSKHYILAGIFLPVFAVINIFLVSKAIDYIRTKYTYLQPVSGFNPLLIVTVYLVSFSLPHLIYKLVLEDIEKASLT